MLLVARVVCIRSASSDRLELVVSYQPQLVQQVEEAVKLQGCSVQLNLERASALLVICPPLILSNGSVQAAAAAAAVAQQQLSGIAGVRDVGFNQVAGVVPPLEVVTPSSAAQTSNGSCTYTPNPANPDFMLGRDSEGVPYGVRMVQADTEEFIQLSKGVKGKVLYCVIDSGMDMDNKEMPHATGCMPGIRTNGNRTTGFRLCTPFNIDLRGHGTMVTGAIAAVRNQLGIVGVAAEGADVYHYTGVNEKDEILTTVMVDGLSDCLDELEYRQRSNPALKLVINMSFGAPGGIAFAVQQIVQRIAKRKDVLMFAAAGNQGRQAAVLSCQLALFTCSPIMFYPAAFPEVISVGAVDYNQMSWSSSNYNRDVELTAAGVADPTLFIEPAVSVAIGSAGSSLTGELMDCGLGQQRCTNATGKICLLERGGATPTWPAFVCLKVVNCMQGTSVASPAVAGVAGVVWSAHPLCTAAEIRKALKHSALKPWLTPGLNATDPGQQRTDRYGYGIVQGLAAHKYLQKNVCYALLPRPQLLLTITPRSRKVGETVVVRVTVRFAPAASGGASPSVASRTVVLSPAAASMSCGSTRPRVNANGVASTTCKLLKSGRVVLAARLPASRFWQAASASQGLTIAKRK
eukprot:gene10849-11003_t